MKKAVLIVILAMTSASTCLAGERCGEEGLSCSEEEVCCENIVASFGENSPVGPSYIQGKCLPKGQKCDDFVCGNRHCQGGFFKMPTVCCIRQLPDAMATYSCASSELGCPGNTEMLTIRGTQTTRTLHRG